MFNEFNHPTIIYFFGNPPKDAPSKSPLMEKTLEAFHLKQNLMKSISKITNPTADQSQFKLSVDNEAEASALYYKLSQISYLINHKCVLDMKPSHFQRYLRAIHKSLTDTLCAIHGECDTDNNYLKTAKSAHPQRAGEADTSKFKNFKKIQKISSDIIYISSHRNKDSLFSNSKCEKLKYLMPKTIQPFYKYLQNKITIGQTDSSYFGNFENYRKKIHEDSAKGVMNYKPIADVMAQTELSKHTKLLGRKIYNTFKSHQEYLREMQKKMGPDESSRLKMLTTKNGNERYWFTPLPKTEGDDKYFGYREYLQDPRTGKILDPDTSPRGGFSRVSHISKHFIGFVDTKKANTIRHVRTFSPIKLRETIVSIDRSYRRVTPTSSLNLCDTFVVKYQVESCYYMAKRAGESDLFEFIVSPQNDRHYEKVYIKSLGVFTIFKTILESFKAIHVHDLFHGDIKPENMTIQNIKLGSPPILRIIDLDEMYSYGSLDSADDRSASFNVHTPEYSFYASYYMQAVYKHQKLGTHIDGGLISIGHDLKPVKTMLQSYCMKKVCQIRDEYALLITILKFYAVIELCLDLKKDDVFEQILCYNYTIIKELNKTGFSLKNISRYQNRIIELHIHKNSFEKELLKPFIKKYIKEECKSRVRQLIIDPLQLCKVTQQEDGMYLYDSFITEQTLSR